MRVAEQILENARQHPAKAAVSIGSDARSYGALATAISEIASCLGERLQAHARVGIYLPTSVELVELFLGATEARLAAVMLSGTWSARELDAAIDEARPEVVIVDARWADRLPVDLSMPVVCVEVGGETSVASQLLASAFGGPGGSWVREPLRDAFYIGFTSGTSGSPKGFHRSPASWVRSFEACELFGVTASSNVLVPGSLDGSLSLFASLHALHAGAQLHLLRRFLPGSAVARLTEHEITHICTVPSMLVALADAARSAARSARFASVQALIAAGASWPEWLHGEARACFPSARMFSYYGASELSFVCWREITRDASPGSLGTPFPGVEISLRRLDGSEVDDREVDGSRSGLLWVRSPMLFDGYLDAERSRQRIDDQGWATAGDVVRDVGDGTLELLGRSDTMLVTGGANVYPEHVERVLEELPGVIEAIVAGAPDRELGTILCAGLRLEPGHRVTLQEVRAHARHELDRRARPRRWFVLESVPLTSFGKPSREAFLDLLSGDELVGSELR